MSRKVLDNNVGASDVDAIMDSIIAQNPQLNAKIEQVYNDNNAYLCEVLRIYPYEDKAYVRVLNNNKNIFCNLSHEFLGGGMSIDYLPSGVEKVDKDFHYGKKYVEPFNDIYGIVLQVRWKNISDENVLLGYVNLYGSSDLKSSSNVGEISLKSGSSNISITNERVNIMTPSLFINGLPYDEPELKNYYDKSESDLIINSLNIGGDSGNDDPSQGGTNPPNYSEYVRKSDVRFNVSLEDNGTMIFNLSVGE